MVETGVFAAWLGNLELEATSSGDMATEFDQPYRERRCYADERKEWP